MKLAGVLAAAALTAVPLATQAQDHDGPHGQAGYRIDERGGPPPYDAYPVGGYGADYAYSYPDAHGTYQPFDYSYSARDDAYYADRGYADDDGGYDYSPAYVGWSAGGPPVDCGRWIWREDRSAYQWAPAPCR